MNKEEKQIAMAIWKNLQNPELIEEGLDHLNLALRSISDRLNDVESKKEIIGFIAAAAKVVEQLVPVAIEYREAMEKAGEQGSSILHELACGWRKFLSYPRMVQFKSRVGLWLHRLTIDLSE